MKRFVAMVATVAMLAFAGAVHAGNCTWAEDSDYGRQNFGALFALFGTVTLSSSYATAGDTLAASTVGLTKITRVAVHGPSNGGYAIRSDLSGTGALIEAFAQDAGGALAEVAAATDLSAEAVEVVVYGY